MSQSDDKKPPAKKSTSAKKVRDTPSRPLSAYNFFFREQRAKILEERDEEAKTTGKVPDRSNLFSILGKTIAQRWKGKTEADREPYRNMAAQDMKRYRKEMDQYHEEVSKNFELEEGKVAALIRSSKKPKAKKAPKSLVGDESTASVKEEEDKESVQVPVSALRSVHCVTLPVPGGSAQASSLTLDALNYQLGLQGGSAMHLPQSATADLLAYQNLVRQRELAALLLQQQQQRQQQSLLLSGLTSSRLASDSVSTSLGHSGSVLETFPGLLPSSNPGIPSPSLMPVSSGLTPQQQLYLLNNHSQPGTGLTVQQRLELMQRNPPSVDMSTSPNLSLLQQRQLLLDQQQRLIERQRLEQLLASQTPPGPKGNPPPSGL